MLIMQSTLDWPLQAGLLKYTADKIWIKASICVLYQTCCFISTCNLSLKEFLQWWKQMWKSRVQLLFLNWILYWLIDFFKKGKEEKDETHHFCNSSIITALLRSVRILLMFLCLRFQRLNRSRPSLSSTMWGELPGSCPSRKEPLCFCITERLRTGGRDATTVLTASSHISTS